VASAVQLDPAEEARPARLSLEQYHLMIEAGVLADGDPIELIDGLLVLKDRAAEGDERMTHGARHASVLRRLTGLQPRVAALGCHVQIQLPITLPPRSEPEPDAAIVKGGTDAYEDRHPGRGDVLVVVEVADSSRRFDRGAKLRLYAAGGLPVYVVVDLPCDLIEVYTNPGADGYGSRSEHRRGEVIALPVGSGGLELAVEELLPPR
jgi:Uma2 family endonuclease